MSPVRRITYVDQTADLVRNGIASGRWKNRLPGLRKLSEEFSVSRQTLRQALARLVKDGLLEKGGDSEAHVIRHEHVAPDSAPRPLRIAIVLPRPIQEEDAGLHRTMQDLLVRLESDGHECTLTHFPNDRNPDRLASLARVVANIGADLWLVNVGGEDVLGWFHESGIPVLAMGGRIGSRPIPLISYDRSVNIREATRRFIALGHRRIVLITRRILRAAPQGAIVTGFREELAAAGVIAGEYHTPDWEETPEGLETLLESLFKLTPPTALICDTASITLGAYGFLLRRGLRVPADVSIIAGGENCDNRWLFPSIRLTHYDATNEAYVKAVRHWVRDYSEGRTDTRRHMITGAITEGDSVGPAPKH